MPLTPEERDEFWGDHPQAHLTDAASAEFHAKWDGRLADAGLGPDGNPLPQKPDITNGGGTVPFTEATERAQSGDDQAGPEAEWSGIATAGTPPAGVLRPPVAGSTEGIATTEFGAVSF